MALPYGNVSACESFFVGLSSDFIHYESGACRGFCLVLCLRRGSVVCEFRGYEFVDSDLSAIDFSELVILVIVREKAFEGALEPFDVLLMQRIVAETFSEIEIKIASALHDGFYLDLAVDART